MTGPADLTWVHYLPAATTAVAAAFSFSLFRKYRVRPTPHIGWWAVGVATYGTGTLLETVITLAGNTVVLTRLWYVAGAVLGAYPLAQGSLYLLSSRRFANRATMVSLPFVVLTALLVLLSPIVADALEPHRPSGAVLAWGWVRLLTPFINLYAAFFLIGGAVVSAWRFRKSANGRHRAAGNALIAFGALLPAIGGALARTGLVEALYVAEFAGLVFIWGGERTCAMRSGARLATLAREGLVADEATERPMPPVKSDHR
ncbi:MAG: hypothetical protein OXG04_04465 [Acidobacteria bacterium]|nr:hypothetical protein [Acidobacteriota bacterium]